MSYNESETNFVAVAGALERRHKRIFDTILSECKNAGIGFHVIGSAVNIWVRDWLPIQAPDGFVKFHYGYGKDNPQFRSLDITPGDWTWLSDFGNNDLRTSSIRLDGGNVVRHGDDIICTDIIYKHNPLWHRKELKRRLGHTLGGTIHVIPREPGDDIGHTDGICHFIPTSGHLIIQKFNEAYSYRITRALKGAFQTWRIPNGYRHRLHLTEKQFRKAHPEADTFNPGFGYYVNFLLVGKLIFFPQFEGIRAMNEAALYWMSCYYPGFHIVPVECSDLSMEGGLLNCVTMNYRL